MWDSSNAINLAFGSVQSITIYIYIDIIYIYIYLSIYYGDDLGTVYDWIYWFTTSRGAIAQACAQFHHKEKAGDVVEVLDDLHDMRMVQSL